MTDPPREKTKSESLLARLESRVSKLTSRVKILEVELEKAKKGLKATTDELGAVREKLLHNLARIIHGTEPPPAIKRPEEKDD